jgi:hypothetical protein
MLGQCSSSATFRFVLNITSKAGIAIYNLVVTKAHDRVILRPVITSIQMKRSSTSKTVDKSD